jgi:UDP-glucose 4-epimerase
MPSNKYCNFIVGSSGTIGRRLTSHLIEKNTNVFTFSRKEIKSYSKNHFIGDLLDKKLLLNISNQLTSEFDQINIFYLAGISSVQESFNYIGKKFSESVESYCNLLDSFIKTNSRIIFTSSGSVYDTRNKQLFRETDALNPVSPYSTIKLACEKLSTIYSDVYGLDIRIARIFSVYGESVKKLFIYDCINKILNAEKSITLKGNGYQERDYLYLDDVVRGLETILEKGEKSETYNLSSGKPTKISTIVDQIKDSLEMNYIKVNWSNNDTFGESEKWYGDNSKIKNIGFSEKEVFERQLHISTKKIFNDLKNSQK